jgi:anti-sigma B factor antagonist
MATILVSNSSQGDWQILGVDGELDLSTSERFREALTELVDASPYVAIDLRAVSFMDSTGLQALMQADDASAQDGWTWTILASDAVMRVVELAALEERLPVRREPPAAADAVPGGA